jgi:hypothetical protein
MQLVAQIILLGFLTVLLTNCTLLKKRHSVGYKVEWNKRFKKSNSFVAEKKSAQKESTDTDTIVTNKETVNKNELTSVLEEEGGNVIFKNSTDNIESKSPPSTKTLVNITDKLIKTKIKVVEPNSKQINKNATIGLILSLVAIIFLTAFTTLNFYIVLIGVILLVGGFIFALIANKQMTKQLEKFNRLSKLFTLFSAVIYFIGLSVLLVWLLAIIAGFFFLLILFLFTNEFPIILALLFIILLLFLLSILVYSIITFVKSLKRKSEKQTKKDSRNKPQDEPYDNPYRK